MRREGNGERRKGVKEEQEKMRNEGERKRKKVGIEEKRKGKEGYIDQSHSQWVQCQSGRWWKWLPSCGP